MIINNNLMIPLILLITLILYFLKKGFYKYYDIRSILLALLFMFFSVLFGFIGQTYALIVIQHGFLALSASFFAIDAFKNKPLS